jgi:hypothetical protein
VLVLVPNANETCAETFAQIAHPELFRPLGRRHDRSNVERERSQKPGSKGHAGGDRTSNHHRPHLPSSMTLTWKLSRGSSFDQASALASASASVQSQLGRRSLDHHWFSRATTVRIWLRR